MGMMTYLKRGVKYILKGQPQVVINAEIVEKKPEDILKNKKIVITGGGSGLGYYIAKKLHAEGATVIITGRNEEKLKEAAKSIGKENMYYKVFDVTEVSKTENFINELFKEYNAVDCLINNAGVSLHEKSFEEVTIENFEKQFDTNIKGGYFLTQAYIKYLKKNKIKNGNIIFISSERGSQCDFLPYGLTKNAINSFVEGLSCKYYSEGIRINGVAPGITASDMTGIKKEDNLYCEYNKSKRFFVPEEVAETVCFLVSDNSKCISGEIIHCDGGNHLNPWFM